jgi:hypothetical protein
MVDRVESTSPSRDGVVSATPAPVTVHKRYKKRRSDCSDPGNRSVEYDRVMSHETTVKQEVDSTDMLQEKVLHPESQKQDSAVATPSFASRYFTTPQTVATDPESGCREVQPNSPHTPIFDLLWDKSSVDFEARQDVVLVIMKNLDQRVPAQVVIPVKFLFRNKSADVFSPSNSIPLTVALSLKQSLC